MPRADQEQQIVFGPGGQIRNVQQNKMLIDQLLEKPALAPEELLRLAKFYKAYPTGVPLGNHLALLALAARDGGQVSQIVFSEYNDAGDSTEDAGEHIREYHEPAEDEAVLLSVRRTLFSGIELLIETLEFKSDSGDERLHYIIAVSPGPDNLRDETRFRVYPLTSKKRKG